MTRTIRDILTQRHRAQLAAPGSDDTDWLGLLSTASDPDLGSALVRLARMAATIHEQESLLGGDPTTSLTRTRDTGVTR